MCRYIRIIFFFTTYAFILVISHAEAVDETKLAKSVETLYENWMSVLSKGIVTSTQGCGDLWRSSKYVFIRGSDDLKVVKTDLVVPYYHLYIRFKLRWLGVNSVSKYASTHGTKCSPGFSTLKDSRRHMDDSNFGFISGPLGKPETVYEHNLRYDLVGDKWLIRFVDENWHPVDSETMYGEENKNLFEKLLSLPIKDFQ